MLVDCGGCDYGGRGFVCGGCDGSGGSCDVNGNGDGDSVGDGNGNGGGVVLGRQKQVIVCL